MASISFVGFRARSTPQRIPALAQILLDDFRQFTAGNVRIRGRASIFIDDVMRSLSSGSPTIMRAQDENQRHG